VRYFDHVETCALQHLTSLRELELIENPTRDPSSADWVLCLPPSLIFLTVSGDASISGGISYAQRRRVQPLRTVPRILGLDRLVLLCFRGLRGFRVSEWNATSCLMGLSNLQSLEMSMCGLLYVPQAVVGLSGLRRLCLGGNKIESLPLGRYLHIIDTLLLVDNMFSNVPLEALSAATTLTCLTMGGNPLAWTHVQEEFVKRIKRFDRTHQENGCAPHF
jgi:hypothetical protein